MLGLLRTLAEAGTAASWIFCFIAAIVAVFTLYIGIAMWATYRADDPKQIEVRYKIFDALVRPFHRRWWR